MLWYDVQPASLWAPTKYFYEPVRAWDTVSFLAHRPCHGVTTGSVFQSLRTAHGLRDPAPATHSLECPGCIPPRMAPSFACPPGVVEQSVQAAPSLPQSAQDAVEEALRQAKEQAGQAERDLLEAKVLCFELSNIYLF